METFFFGIFMIVLLLVSLSLLKRSRKIAESFLVSKARKLEKKYGEFAPLYERCDSTIFRILHHRYRPRTSAPLLKSYRKRLFSMIQKLNRIYLIFDRVRQASDNMESESSRHICSVYLSLRDRLIREADNLGELYALCERKTIDGIISNIHPYSFDTEIKSLIDSMSNIEKDYPVDVLSRQVVPSFTVQAV